MNDEHQFGQSLEADIDRVLADVKRGIVTEGPEFVPTPAPNIGERLDTEIAAWDAQREASPVQPLPQRRVTLAITLIASSDDQARATIEEMVMTGGSALGYEIVAIRTVGLGPDNNAGHCPECGGRAAIVDTPTHVFFACRRCQVKWLYDLASYKGELSRAELTANDARMQSYRTVEQPNNETPFQ